MQTGAELETLLLATSAAAAVARGMALVRALQPADFRSSEGAGDEAQDFYAAEYAGRPLRVGLRPYGFPGQPRLLMVTITALPAARGAGPF